MSALPQRPLSASDQSDAELFRRTIPVRQRRELLTSVATCWRETFGWPWCAAVMFLPMGKHAAAQLVCESAWPLFREWPLPPDGRSLAEKLEVSCRQELGETLLPGPLHVTLLDRTRDPRGAIVSPGAVPESSPLLPATLKLLRQLEEVEAARPNGVGFDWLHRRKMDALIEFAAGAGHEINNPVAAISGRVQLLLKSQTDPALREALATIGAQALRISQMIGDTIQFAEPPPLSITKCDVKDVVQRVVKKLKPRIVEQAAEVKLKIPAGLTLAADEGQLEVLATELLLNSLDAIPRGGRTMIAAAPPRTADSNLAELEFCDNGPGLTEQDRLHLFDPFYSGRQAGRGLGFGLCKCWRIAYQHGGSITVRSVPWVETAFTLQWPVASG